MLNYPFLILAFVTLFKKGLNKFRISLKILSRHVFLWKRNEEKLIEDFLRLTIAVGHSPFPKIVNQKIPLLYRKMDAITLIWTKVQF